MTNYTNWLYEKQGAAQKLFATDYVALAELSGVINTGDGVIRYDTMRGRFTRAMDGNREVYDGSNVRFPLMLAGMPAGGNPAEGGTWNAPIPIQTSKATCTLARVLQPLAVSIDVERDSSNGSTSARSIVSNYMEEAYKAVARIENDEIHGGTNAIGTGTTSDLLAAVASNTNSPGLVIDVGTGANFDQLTPGRVVDFLTVTTGVATTNGLRRLITSVSRTNGTITVSTTAQASDGGSGNVTFASTTGVYIPGSYGQGLQSLAQTVATTGTFEAIDKATTPAWQGVDATPSAAQALSDTLLDDAVYKLRGQGVGYSDFGIAHPKTVDLYKSSKASLVRYDAQEAVLKSGFAGIVYQGADKPFPIVKDLNAPRGVCRLLKLESFQLYGDSVGPAFLDDDGSMWRYFSRALVKEADLLDRVQLAVKACNKNATIGNATTKLSEAA